MCEFCDNQKQKLIPDEDLEYIKEMLADGNEANSYSSVYLENDELYFDSSCKEYPHSKVKINFCPMCGRDLRSDYAKKLKLYRIDYMDDCDDDVCLMVAKSERDVKEKFEKEVFSKLSCPMFYHVFEIREIEGHKIVVE